MGSMHFTKACDGWVGLGPCVSIVGWVGSIIDGLGWVGLGDEKWTHVHL